MLSDTVHEKSRNPLKKAMRRRNAKTVAFTDPIYHEASEYEYSDEDEDEEGAEGFEIDGDDSADSAGGNVEVGNDTKPESKPAAVATIKVVEEKPAKPVVNVITPPTDPRTSCEAQKRADETKVKAATNTAPICLRHPETAIFNDTNTGTKKLTLTPNLLRDDNAGILSSPISKTESNRSRKSMESEKQGAGRGESVLSPPPGKDGKRLKKGSSVLGNLFKKRNKKGRKEDEEEVEEWLHGHGDKGSMDSGRSLDMTPRDSPGGQDDEARKEREEALLKEEQRKLQERQRQRQQEQAEEQRQQAEKIRQQEQRKQHELMQQELEREERERRELEIQMLQQEQEREDAARRMEAEARETQALRSQQDKVRNGFGPPVDTSRAGNTNGNARNQIYSPKVYQPAATIAAVTDRLSESPEQITFHDAAERPDLVIDTSSGAESNEASSSPINSSPEMITFEAAAAAAAAPAMTRTWSDWSLRTYFEDDNDVRDMLIVVQQDKGDIVHSKQHPDISPIFADSTKRLADITKVCALALASAAVVANCLAATRRDARRLAAEEGRAVEKAVLMESTYGSGEERGLGCAESFLLFSPHRHGGRKTVRCL